MPWHGTPGKAACSDDLGGFSLLTPPPAEPCLRNVWEGRRRESWKRGEGAWKDPVSRSGMALTWSTMACFQQTRNKLNKYLAQYDDLDDFLTFRLVNGRRPGPSSPHPVIGDNLEMSRAWTVFVGEEPYSESMSLPVGWLMPVWDRRRVSDLESGSVDT